MEKVGSYAKMLCPFCTRAKKLLASKGASFEEDDITMGGPKRAEMLQRAPGSATVPQVFINDRHIGGSDELAALDASGGLDPLLAACSRSHSCAPPSSRRPAGSTLRPTRTTFCRRLRNQPGPGRQRPFPPHG